MHTRLIVINDSKIFINLEQRIEKHKVPPHPSLPLTMREGDTIREKYNESFRAHYRKLFVKYEPIKQKCE